MNLKRIRSKGPEALMIIAAAGLIYWWTPILKTVFIGKTISLFKETRSEFEQDEVAAVYRGSIVDSTVKYNKAAGKYDTLVHRQQILLSPEKNDSTGGKPSYGDFGAFSDGAGLLNAVFSGLAFIAVIITIILQRRKDSRDKDNAARVQFEEQFFSMTSMLEDIVAHLRYTETPPAINILDEEKARELQYEEDPDNKQPNKQEEIERTIYEGREVFWYIYSERKVPSLLDIVNMNESIRDTYDALRLCYDGALDHYFRYLYRILKHIKESKLLDKLPKPEDERRYYAHLLRAQLSSYELLMWFYNCLLPEFSNAKEMIENFTMFNNLRVEQLGRYQQGYCEKVKRGSILYRPEDFNEKEQYEITAFVDEEELKRRRKNAKKKKESLVKLFVTKMQSEAYYYNEKARITLREWETKFRNWCKSRHEVVQEAPENVEELTNAEMEELAAHQPRARRAQPPVSGNKRSGQQYGRRVHRPETLEQRMEENREGKNR